jgi:RND family efflux transporter MFP subunit
MRYSKSDQPGSQETNLADTTLADTTEDKLRAEIEDLKRQIQERPSQPHAAPRASWHPSGVVIWSIFLGVIVVIAVAFFAGDTRVLKRAAIIRAEAREQQEALPRVVVMEVGRSTHDSELELPGNIQAATEAPILARADGYIRSRMVDIGDRVRAGQPLAEIEAPELDQQVDQAKANLEQARAALDQTVANQHQGKANEELARVTANRWTNLVGKGVVSRQENDQYQAQYQAQVANLESLEKAVAVARSNVSAAEANLGRLNEMQSYRVVKAPFDGVITLRNVDVGALVNTGNTMLFRIAQTATLRTYVNVPQTNSSSIRVGQAAQLSVTNLPGRHFAGTVARTANSLDPTTRTLLVEVHVPNPDGALLPGMYAQVDLSTPRADPPLLVPSDAMIVRTEGTQVAVVRPDHTVHLQKIDVGRDYGDRIEVLGGLNSGDLIVQNPGDVAREGVKIDPVFQTPKDQPPSAKGASK